MYPEPSAPPLLEILKDEAVCYGCEDNCDVEFIVGKTDDDLMRIPVHSCKLAHFPVFEAMFSDKFSNINNNCVGQNKLKQIHVREVDGKAFDNLMKFIYKKPVNLQSPEMTIETLKAAHEFLFPGLVRACVKQLSKMISLDNVLFIFAHARLLCNDMENLEALTKTTCMPFPKRHKHTESANNHSSAGLEMKTLLVWLLCQCLAFIDVQAAKVLDRDEVEYLDRTYLSFILKRDSLAVSESVVFSALSRWAETECKRDHLPLTSESKRRVLHDLLYLVRYFQMTSWEFSSGPAESGLLNPMEVQVITGMIARNCDSNRKLKHSGHHYCHPQHLNMENNEALSGLHATWQYMSQPRNPLVNRDSGDHKKFVGANGKRRNSAKFRNIGVLVKRLCLPCAYMSRKENIHEVITNSQHKNYNKNKDSISSQKDANNNDGGNPGTGSKRKESTLSKAFDFSLRAFAFFFD